MHEKVELLVAWADYQSAAYACRNWHYSRSVPAGKLVKIGAWEDGNFVGVVIFSRGANSALGNPYGLGQTECCELTRIALRKHKSFVSEILSKAIRLLRESSPGLRLIVSYADKDQNHHGGIYQATNWIYTGIAECGRYFIVHGKKTHPKSIHSKYGTGAQKIEWLRENVDPNADTISTGGKHRYLMPLDKRMRKKIQTLAQPYPKSG